MESRHDGHACVLSMSGQLEAASRLPGTLTARLTSAPSLPLPAGADLANLVNEAALLAGRTNRNDVSRAEFDTAILRSIAGIEKKRSILQGLEKDVVAKHEVGRGGGGGAVAGDASDVVSPAGSCWCTVFCQAPCD